MIPCAKAQFLLNTANVGKSWKNGWLRCMCHQAKVIILQVLKNPRKLGKSLLSGISIMSSTSMDCKLTLWEKIINDCNKKSNWTFSLMPKTFISWKSIWIYLKSQIKFWNLKSFILSENLFKTSQKSFQTSTLQCIVVQCACI